jgi:hypothetical protein
MKREWLVPLSVQVLAFNLAKLIRDIGQRQGGVSPLGSFAAHGWGRNSRAHHGRAVRSAMRSGRRPVPGGDTPP